MRRKSIFLDCIIILLLSCAQAAAESLTIRGIVHDPQHRPIPEASVTLSSTQSVLSFKARTNSQGEFEFARVPTGNYTINVAVSGFAPLVQPLQVDSKDLGILHLQMAIAAVAQKVEVSGAAARLNTQSATTRTSISQQQIAHTPGADLTNSLAMITDFVPGATMVHDMLHVRGGHQENWFFDGIPVINTNIASNVGPMINPKDVESLEVETGGYSSEYGDRTYGFFNVITPSGFDKNNQGELMTSYGSFNQTDDLLSIGGHTERFAYYGSLDGNRSDLGLSTPTPLLIHDQESGLGGFASILFNPSAQNQLRFVASLRGDHYQIPNTPEQQAIGIRDLDVERDDMFGFTWAHSSPGGMILTVSPFFHFNRADYLGGPNDTPFVLNDNRRSSYMGALATVAVNKGKHDARLGAQVWGQHDETLFGLRAHPGNQMLVQSFVPWANSEAVFAEDQYKAASWLTLNGGMRLTHYGGLISENAADPRLGAAIRIPRLGWILRGYYAAYYQPPPLDTISGPLLNFALQQGAGFIPLRGERDVQHDIGMSIPIWDWLIDVDNFRTSANNFLDHDEVGNSDIFLPLTDLAALIRGTEVTVRSPQLLGRGQLRIAYSNQFAEGLGPITGGLLGFAPTRYFLLDHDQRNTVSTVLNVRLPRRSWASSTYAFGSGFVNGNGPAHLPPHSVWDVALGKSIGENFSITLNALNLVNTRFQLDDSNTFGGTHYANPRSIYVAFRWRFHY